MCLCPQDNLISLLASPFWASSCIFFFLSRSPLRQHSKNTSTHWRFGSTRETLRILSSQVRFMGMRENPCAQHSCNFSSVKFDSESSIKKKQKPYVKTQAIYIISELWCLNAVLLKVIISCWRSIERLCRVDWESQSRPGKEVKLYLSLGWRCGELGLLPVLWKGYFSIG